MKIFISIALVYLYLMLMGSSGFAQTKSPPEPTQIRPLAGDITPPDGPIDSNIYILALAGTALGLYIIYKNSSNKKSPA